MSHYILFLLYVLTNSLILMVKWIIHDKWALKLGIPRDVTEYVNRLIDRPRDVADYREYIINYLRGKFSGLTLFISKY